MPDLVEKYRKFIDESLRKSKDDILYIPKPDVELLIKKICQDVRREEKRKLTQNYKMERQESKKVYQYDCVTGAFIKEYNSVREAARITGLNRFNMQEMLNSKKGVRHSVGGYKFSYTPPDKKTKADEAFKMPMTLFIDIETSLLEALVWGVGKTDIHINQLMSDRFLLCWSAKWLYSNKVLSACLNSKEVLQKDDSRIIKSIYKLINSADIIIAHNGLAFDIKILKTRFLVHGLPPPNPYQFVDTCLVARKEFGNISNKLDWIQRMLGMTEKLHTDFSLWIRCFHGDSKALKQMVEYNRVDVLALEENYLRIRPYIKSHPNLGLFICEPKNPQSRCPNCGAIIASKQWDRKIFYYTQVAKYSTFRCTCGYVGHSRYTALSKQDKDVLVTTCAR